MQALIQMNKGDIMKEPMRYAAIISAVMLMAGCSAEKAPDADVAGHDDTAVVSAASNENEAVRDEHKIIEELAVYYGTYGNEALDRVDELIEELRLYDADSADRWKMITRHWAQVNNGLSLNYDVLPDGLAETDELCIVALGFQLAPDGSMRPELIERLKVVLNSARKYPDALIVCTGGGTAAENKNATEAGKMAEWLIENGVDEKRIIVEDKSMTTAQNAVFTYDILSEKYPQVTQLAVISSDYHIATGTLLFDAECILRAEKAGAERMKVVSNAAYKAPSGTLSTMFQAGALIELSGDVETAYKIYYEEYDIHELPALEKTDE